MAKVRPTSPFLSIYKPQIGSIFSIFERITGVLLLLSLILFLSLSLFKTIGLTYYTTYSLVFFFYKGSFSNIFVSSFLVLLLSSFIYHILFAIRFIFWGITSGSEEVFGLNLESLYKIANIVAILTVTLTIIFWVLI